MRLEGLQICLIEVGLSAIHLTEVIEKLDEDKHKHRPHIFTICRQHKRLDTDRQGPKDPILTRRKSQRFNLAGQEGRALLPLAREPADSGIDSDETDSERRVPHRAHPNDESQDEESDVTVEIDMPVPWNYCVQHPNRSFAERPARASPSLFEVELTASDEDDASVLELIIPYQQPRYKKLPTSSPLKTKIRAPKYLCWFFCCFRK